MKYGYRDNKESRTYVAESDLTTLYRLPQFIGYKINPETGKQERDYIRHDLDESYHTPGHKLASLRVERPSEIPVQDLMPKEGEQVQKERLDGTSSIHDVTLEHNLKNKAYMNTSEIKDFMNKQQMTPQLFVHKPAVITDAIAHPDMKAYIPTLAGLAINEYKGDIMASPDLSVHSSPLVKRGIEAGLLKPHPLNPRAEPTNEIDYEDLDDYGDEFPYKRYEGDLPAFSHEIDKGTANQAKRTAMQALRGRGEQLSMQFGVGD